MVPTDDGAVISAKDEARDPFGRGEIKGISQPTPGMNAKQTSPSTKE
jgi:hypothetical protein